MAELLIAKGWTPPDPLALDLEENLPERWTVVVGPKVWGRTLDAVVVTEQGLAVLHARDWGGTIRVAAQGEWHAIQPDGASQALPNPAEAVRATTRALVRYLADEFPMLHPPIAHIVVLTGTATPPPDAAGADLPVVRIADLLPAIEAVLPGAPEPLLSADAQAMVAHMLWQRRLTRRQKAANPFVFRSGNAAWSIADLVAQADRAPDDGVYHLRNGTLARWFDEQGAPDLANVARDALQAFPLDARAALEVLLQETGVVERPTLSVYPPRLDLGAVVAGCEQTASFRIRQRGRGYLFGALFADSPWLHLETHTFAGADNTVTVRADTRELPIGSRPIEAIIHLTSPVIVAPVEVPVCLRVAPAPTAVRNRLLTPLLWSVATGALGALAVLLLMDWAAWPAENLHGLVASSSAALWAVAALRASAPARPQAMRALLGWLASVAAWTLLLAGGAALLSWLLAAAGVSAPAWMAALPVAAGACGALAALAGRRRQPGQADPPLLPHEIVSAWVRRGAVFAALLLAVVMVFAGWQHPDVQRVRQASQAWLAARLGEADAQLDTWSDDLQVRYYDRRAAPAEPSGVLPTVTPTPAVAGQGG